MKLPKSLSKYESYIDSLNNKVNRNDPKNISDVLLAQILASKEGKLLLRMKTGAQKFQYYMPDNQEIPNCFVKRVWDFATIEDKIKIADKYLDYLFQNNINYRPSLRIVPSVSNNVDNSCLASYEKNHNEVFLNLDKLEEYSGLEFMSFLYHECTHAKDLKNIENNIAPNILSKYTKVKDNEAQIAKLWEKLIIDMPIDEFVYNKKTGEKELIQGIPQQQILKCKNFFSIFNECEMYNPKDVKNKKDFETYLNSILYLYSPLERFARISVRNFFRRQLTDQRIIMEEDIKTAQAIVDSETTIDKYISTFKDFLIRPCMYGGKETIIDMKQLLDLASKYNFYCKKGFGKYTNEQKYPLQAKQVREEYNKTLTELYHNFMLKEKTEERMC